MVAATIIAGGAGFYGGIKYQEGKRGQVFRQFGGGQMMAIHDGQTGRQNFRPISGVIIKADETSITVKLPDGSSKIVLVNDKTTINKAETATKDDLKTGEAIVVFGVENANGTVTAQTVQLNPELRMRGLGGASPSADPKQ